MKEKGPLHLDLGHLGFHAGLWARSCASACLPVCRAPCSASNVVIQSAVNSFGSIVVAGNSAASNLEGFVYTAMNAFAQAAVTFTSQNMRRRRHDNLTASCATALCSAPSSPASCWAAVFPLLGEQLLHFYSSDEVAVTAGLAW